MSGTAPTADRVGLRGNAMLMDFAPYAAWLETEVPNGVIFAAYMAVKRAFGSQLSIRYSYVNPDTFGGQAWKPGQKPGSHPYMIPVLTIGNPGSTVIPGSHGRGYRARRRAGGSRR
jgi:hypothetical protein